ncbi:DUF4190 domain-containing protein [Herbiconiux sp. UC225_62]|uniref:DUF4190 domain-containing protein n=1 Tax=Herbiconiux sp. UC225_62 TaxID=3350168 RepID=UPI0036D2AA04
MDTRTDAADAADADAGGGWAPPTGTPVTDTAAGTGAIPVSGVGRPPLPAPRSAPGQPAPRNEVARWARICAIVSVLFNPLLLVSIAAIVLGIVGLHRSDHPPFAGRFDSGRRQAMTGIGIGVFGLILGITVPALFIAWTVSRLP